MDVRKFLKDSYVILDGAMGTQLQKAGMPVGMIPEKINVINPEMLIKIQKEYVEAGSDIISVNSFGLNSRKIGSFDEMKTLLEAGIDCARKAANGKLIALDMGPTGELIEPMGAMTFDEAYESYKEQVIVAKDKVDLIIIETMSDLYETKAAVLAAKENSDLPIMCSMSFMENKRTFTGTSVEAFALTISPFVDAIGINCSLGPKQILPIMEELAKWTNLPLFIQANAGIPNDKMEYPVKAQEFAQTYKQFMDLGVTIFGGCCGTTPEYIKEVSKIVEGKKVKERKVNIPSAVCSATVVKVIDKVTVIGERINPTGKKLMKQAIIENNFDYISQQAIEQVEADADILDINAGLPEIDEKETLTKIIKFVQGIVPVPLQIDCGKSDAIEKALRYYNGKAIVNSVNGDDKTLDSILPLVKKYGASVVGLTVNEKGLPSTIEERIEIAQKIIERAKYYGIREEDIFIDCLTLTVSVEKNQAINTLKAIEKIKDMYRVKTTLGVSNISFGLPNRQVVNSSFLKTAIAYGLDAPIINPNIEANMKAIKDYEAQKNDYSKEFFYTEFMDAVENNINFTPFEEVKQEGIDEDIAYCIKRGLTQSRVCCKKLLETTNPIDIIDQYLIPALNEVGDEYEKGKLFLPQLIASAESAKLCFEEIKKVMPESNTSRGEIVIATVKGDIHDIGKNIVKTVLENYGYKIYDLGKNIDPQLIVDAAKKHNVKLVGLSALMTTTVGAMEETINLLRKENVDCKVMVGGAVLTQDYADKIGADYYTKDANQSVKVADLVFNH